MEHKPDMLRQIVREVKPLRRLPSRVSLDDRKILLECQEILSETIERAYHLSSYAREHASEAPIAYVTLATPDYDWGARVLLRTLRRYTSIPIIVLAPSRWGLRSDVPDIYLIEVPTLYRNADSARREFAQTFTKLWAFCFLNFRRIVFLDSDTLVLQNLDELFDSDEFLVCRDSVEQVKVGAFNSGLLAFSPKRRLFEKIADHAATAPTKDGGDQGLLNCLFRDEVKYLGSEFNAIKHYLYFRHPDVQERELRMIHYIVKKPWELWYREISDAFCVDLEDLWTNELTRAELLELVSHWRRNQFIAERFRFDVTRQHRKRRKRHRELAIFILSGLVLFGLGAIVSGLLA